MDNFLSNQHMSDAYLLGNVAGAANRLIALNIPALGTKFIHNVHIIRRALCK